ncbi:MAG TPA: hypothetical protein VKA32_08090 [Gammaproteobacteria bacterium]|nr:hypothetical protein [Gammaproteobacteria bacterium]
MIRARDLTLSYLEHHPGEAARVLELRDAGEAAAVLGAGPARVCAPVLAQMLPTRAARCVEQMPDPVAAALIRRVGPQHGASVLRYMNPSQRNRLLGELPTARAMTYRLLIGHPDESVGAWIDPDVLALAGETRAETAIQSAREHEQLRAQTIYVVNEHRRLRGMVPLEKLLRAQPDVRLEHLMEDIAFTLPAQAFLEGTRDHAGWESHAALPVIDHNRGFIGVLYHSALMHAIKAHRAEGPDRRLDDTLAVLGGMYWLSFSAILRALVSTLPDDRDNRSGKDVSP